MKNNDSHPTRLIKWAALLIAFSTLNSTPAAAIGNPMTNNVFVTNGADSPVPISAQGTIQIAGTVNVGNTPNVNVATMPPMAIASGQSISVGNTVLMRDSDNPARAGTTIYADCSEAGSNVSNCTVYTVPAGQKFVVESISEQVWVDHGTVVGARLDSIGGGPIASLAFPFCTLQSATGTQDRYVCTATTRGYAPPNSQLLVTTDANIGGGPAPATFNQYVSISGYLVSVD
jgi:hypothetical protein